MFKIILPFEASGVISSYPKIPGIHKRIRIPPPAPAKKKQKNSLHPLKPGDGATRHLTYHLPKFSRGSGAQEIYAWDYRGSLDSKLLTSNPEPQTQSPRVRYSAMPYYTLLYSSVLYYYIRRKTTLCYMRAFYSRPYCPKLDKSHKGLNNCQYQYHVDLCSWYHIP